MLKEAWTNVVNGGAVGLIVGLQAGVLYGIIKIQQNEYVEWNMILLAAQNFRVVFFYVLTAFFLSGLFYGLFYSIIRQIRRDAVAALIWTLLFAFFQWGVIVWNYFIREGWLRTIADLIYESEGLRRMLTLDVEKYWTLKTYAVIGINVLSLFVFILILHSLKLFLHSIMRKPFWHFFRKLPRRSLLQAVMGEFIILGALAFLLPQIIDPIVTPDIRRIVMVSFDSLRTDRIGAYGSDRSVTPVLDAFSRECMIFSDCSVQEPFALTSQMSFLTSLYPFNHKLDPTTELRPGAPTLTETLRNCGYHSAAFVANNWLKAEYGFDQGFNSYRYLPDYSADQMNQVIFSWLEDNRHDRFFLFINYHDLNVRKGPLPYSPPEPFANLFKTAYDELVFDGCRDDACGAALMMQAAKGKTVLSDAQWKYLQFMYDSAVYYADSRFGRLLEKLKEEKLYQNTMFILYSPHGEEFGDHGSALHFQLYQECVRVPLMLRIPQSVKNKIFDYPIQSIELMPSVLNIIGSPVPYALDGENAVNINPEEIEKRIYGLSHTLKFFPPKYFYRLGPYKLIFHFFGNIYNIFDLKSDPAEMNFEVLGPRPKFRNMFTDLNVWISKNRLSMKQQEKPEFLNPEKLELLRRIGYLP